MVLTKACPSYTSAPSDDDAAVSRCAFVDVRAAMPPWAAKPHPKRRRERLPTASGEDRSAAPCDDRSRPWPRPPCDCAPGPQGVH
eukprot:1633563-Prymnesium_polylepis.2